MLTTSASQLPVQWNLVQNRTDRLCSEGSAGSLVKRYKSHFDILPQGHLVDNFMLAC